MKNNKDYLKEAGQCYYTGKNYLKASEIFEKKECWNEAGKSILKAIETYNNLGDDKRKMYIQAKNLFTTAKNDQKIIFCLEMLEDYEAAIDHCINCKNKIFDFQKNLEKYWNLFLKQINSLIDESFFLFIFMNKFLFKIIFS